ncbi:hypothetical protein PM082_005082 [Marasmius tenuissimus]|nr:hypothetical protein PM082_005082 [Marasmius tenuissimus]
MDGQISPLPHLAGFRRQLLFEPADDSPRTYKRMKTHTDKVCNSAKLQPEDREEVEKFAKLNIREQLIAIFGILTDLDRRVTLQDDEKWLDWAVTLMDSGFHTAISNHVSSCLLAPDITTYVHKAPEVVMKLINQHPNLFGVPKGLLHVQLYYEKLHKLVTVSCSQVRSSMKTKLISSLGKKRKGVLTIVDLCRSLVATSPGMEIKGNHMARVAFLRQCLVKFQALFKPSEIESEEPPVSEITSDTTTEVASDAGSSAPGIANNKLYKTTDFWTYVDDRLVGIRNEVREKHKGTAAQKKMLNQFFQSVLANDLRNYRPATGVEIKIAELDFTPVVVPWQVTIAEGMVF